MKLQKEPCSSHIALFKACTHKKTHTLGLYRCKLLLVVKNRTKMSNISVHFMCVFPFVTCLEYYYIFISVAQLAQTLNSQTILHLFI